MTVYYNEFDPKAAAWLRELIVDGLIAHGEVDERSIVDVAASDLKGFTQHHFFAGIGGWSYALRLAGWPDDLPVWTASLPCQPFSAAGKGLGKQDERHLLPHFIGLVAQCRPTVLFGEQVSAAIKHGWLDDLYTEMEANHYAVGSIVIGAHSIGAAHIRQRLYWVADNGGARREKQPGERRILPETHGNDTRKNVAGGGWMGNTEHYGCITSKVERCDGSTIPNSATRQDGTGELEGASTSTPIPRHIGLPNATSERCGEARSDSVRSEERTAGSSNGLADTEITSRERPESGSDRESYSGELDWIYCRDNKYRPVKSGIKPLVNGVPRGMVHHGDPFNTQEARAVRLKGYGNAIVPTLAAEFIKAYML